MMGLDSRQRDALDRHITGNYGEDQFKGERDFCIGPHDLVFIGDEPNDYDYPETGTHKVYACRFCGDLFDRRDCQKELRDGGCVLDLNHRGRCSTVGFYCDGCGQMRRSYPIAHARDVDGEPLAAFCFMCVVVEKDRPKP